MKRRFISLFRLNEDFLVSQVPSFLIWIGVLSQSQNTWSPNERSSEITTRLLLGDNRVPSPLCTLTFLLPKSSVSLFGEFKRLVKEFIRYLYYHTWSIVSGTLIYSIVFSFVKQVLFNDVFIFNKNKQVLGSLKGHQSCSQWSLIFLLTS